MNPLFSIMIMTLFIITAVSMVISMGNPIIEKAKAAAAIGDARSEMVKINDAVMGTVSEGNGSSRKVSMGYFDGEFVAMDSDDSIRYSMTGPVLSEYLSRSYSNGFYTISGNDVDCYESGGFIVMENSRIAFYFKMTGSPESPAAIDTSLHLNRTLQKESGVMLMFSNTSISIDDSTATIGGTGYSELLEEGVDMPVCISHFHVSPASAAPYDVYYILFAGADYIIGEVSGVSYASTITSSFACHINTTDTIRVDESSVSSSSSTDQTYSPSKRFISGDSNGSAFAAVFAGKYFNNISLNTSYPGDDYLFRLRQGAEGNRILLAFASGTWEDIDDDMMQVDYSRMVGMTFGNFSDPVVDKMLTTLFAFYKDVNITGRIRWKAIGQPLYISNMGKVSNVTNIVIETG